MTGRGQPWKTAIANALGAARRFPTAAHRPWKTLRVSHIPPAPTAVLFSLKKTPRKEPSYMAPHPAPSGSSFDENMLDCVPYDEAKYLPWVRGRSIPKNILKTI